MLDIARCIWAILRGAAPFSLGADVDAALLDAVLVRLSRLPGKIDLFVLLLAFATGLDEDVARRGGEGGSEAAERETEPAEEEAREVLAASMLALEVSGELSRGRLLGLDIAASA